MTHEDLFRRLSWEERVALSSRRFCLLSCLFQITGGLSAVVCTLAAEQIDPDFRIGAGTPHTGCCKLNNPSPTFLLRSRVFSQDLSLRDQSPCVARKRSLPRQCAGGVQPS
jgi:hypothetical protein